MIIDLSGEIEVLPDFCLFPVSLNLYDGLLDVSIVPLIDFQGFLLQSFGSIGPIAFRRFLHTEDIPSVTSANPYFAEVGATFLVLQTVDSKNLLKLYLCQSKLVSHILIVVLELRLIEQDGHIRIGYDSLFQNVRR